MEGFRPGYHSSIESFAYLSLSKISWTKLRKIFYFCIVKLGETLLTTRQVDNVFGFGEKTSIENKKSVAVIRQ